MLPHDMFADCQTEAGAPIGTRGATFHLIEPVKYPLTLFFRDAYPSIRNPQPHMLAQILAANGDASAGRRELDGIIDQIAEYLLQTHRVSLNGGEITWQCRE